MRPLLLDLNSLKVAARCSLLNGGPMKGKHSMTIVGAAMRKLLHIIFGVLKNKVPFESAALKNL